MSYLSIANLGKEFVQDDSRTEAISDVSLDVPRSSFVSIVGPSGCGKSTLLQIVAGLLDASRGQVLFQETEILAPHFQIIYIFQQYTKSLFPWLTVEKNIAFGLENRAGTDKKGIAEKCAEYVDLMGLCGFENHYPWQLSGGMQQRVALARALVCEPAVLLMDEPFGSVDAMTRVTLQDFILRLWSQLSLTILFVTHDIEEAVYVSQQVIVLSKGPAVVLDDIKIELPYPRDQLATKESTKYLEYRTRVFKQVFA